MWILFLCCCSPYTCRKYSPITSITFQHFAGTGSSGATVRMYVDSYENDEGKIGRSSAEMLSTCVDVALQVFYRR